MTNVTVKRVTEDKWSWSAMTRMQQDISKADERKKRRKRKIPAMTDHCAKYRVQTNHPRPIRMNGQHTHMKKEVVVEWQRIMCYTYMPYNKYVQYIPYKTRLRDHSVALHCMWSTFLLHKIYILLAELSSLAYTYKQYLANQSICEQAKWEEGRNINVD